MTRPASLQVQGILETCINVSDMSRARAFYLSLFGFEIMTSDERFCAFRVGQDVLLLFTEGASNEPVRLEGGTVPPHNTLGAGHFAFAISPEMISSWQALLRDRGVKIESEVRWERGGVSLYFRDPDNNLIELVTPGIWSNF
jgi:catechol 2,3-dioxygenase-like lactoylglutathione lyase family enzyme